MKYYLILLLAGFLAACAGDTPQPIPNAPAHHTTMGYRNPHVVDPDKSFFSFMRMRFFGDDEWADHQALADQVPHQKVDVAKIGSPGDDLQVTWLGHSTFLIQYKGINVLTDPIFSDRASPVGFAGPERYIPHVIDYQSLPPIDLVIISHNHYDHLDEVAVAQLAKDSHFYVPLGIGSWLQEQGVAESHISELDWWHSAQWKGVGIQALPSQHWSARGLGDRFETLWASWSVQIADRHIWFAGDTGYNDIQFKEIGEKVPKIDLALIPIGAYAPRWFMKTYHVNPQEAVNIHLDIKAQRSIGMHWGTFPLTAEPPGEPPIKLLQATQRAGLESAQFDTMIVGQTLTMGD